MVTYAQRTDAGPVVLDPGRPFTVGEGDDAIAYLPPTLTTWSPDDLWSVLGIPQIVEPGPVPDGKVATGMAWGDDDGGPTISRVWVLADAPASPVPETISDRQFAQALASSGVITRDEARAWVKVGDVPAALAAVVDAIGDEDVKFATQMLLEGATQFERHHPQTMALAAAMQWEDPQLDALWTMAAAL
jgi:hypothetical protein